MARREKMSAVDTAWLRMDAPGNAMMICGVLLLRDRVTRARLVAMLEQRFLRFARFRDRPVERDGAAVWEHDERFDIDRHVIDAVLPAPAGMRELQALTSRLASTPLPPGRPRWQFHLVRQCGGGSALILRIHHCYADGIALIQVMLSMTDAAPDGPPALPLAIKAAPRHDASEHDGMLAPVANALALATRVSTTIMQKGAELWVNPAKALELAQQGTSLTREIAVLALMREDSRTRLKGTPQGRKRVAWAQPLALEEVKAIGRALGASVNDVVLACAADAFARYLAASGDGLAGVDVR
ncbi:MAG TPA: wax ester/triacylglycerol synthase domain-containing protein, partial [Casimicrobiaceae bacterium]|nr:wax ester/triacylglycerol synthase domain-containing protein [Casimicrobiaceae bacterium]